ncbi:Transmembrane protease serine 9 [Trichinella sp. T6]|nr:Transmembrane protease serine 9 [Trichinella sp. T6]
MTKFDTVPTVASRSFKVNDDGICGRPKYQPKFNVSDNRITGGEEAIPHSHPWIAFLSLTHGRKFVCGGVVLQSHEKNVTSYVLTAAHCVKNINLANLIVQAGSHDLTYNTERGKQVVTVSRIIISDLYMTNYDHDYAVLVLSSPLKFTDYVIPACLSQELENFPLGSKCLIAGWGGIDGGIYKPVIRKSGRNVKSISSRYLVLPKTLMQAVITIIDDNNCSNAFFASYDSAINLCAADAMGVIGINNYDSGGPLVCLKDGLWSLHGMGVSRAFFDSTQPSASNNSEQIKDGNLECGLPKYQPIYEFSENRVTAGVEAIPHSHPWLVFITSKIKDDKCGGAILPSRERNSSSFILTAAHCIFYLRKEEIMVTAGMHDQSLNNEIGRQSADVKRRVINITYKKNKGYDYGILILLQPLKFNDYVKPICICKEREHLMPGTKCLIAGWGAIDGGAYKPIIKNNTITRRQTVFPTVLMQTVLAVYSNAYCANASFFSMGYDSVINLCAGDDLGEKGVNNADSGMPLVCLSEGLWTMYGIARGRSAFFPKQLSLFIQIASITRFINFYTGYLMQGKTVSYL